MKVTFLILIFFLGSFIALHAQSSGQADTSGTEQQSTDNSLQDEGRNLVFVKVEQMPAFSGNLSDFFKKNLHFPKKAQRQGLISGKVYIQFIVNADGTVSDMRVVKGIGYGCDEEAVRVIQLTSGNWESGKQNGINVRVWYVQPVSFTSAN